MAEIAIGANCSACGTLVACAGSYSDERLTGVCPVCKVAVTTANREYVASVQQEPVAEEPAAEVPAPQPAPEPETEVSFVPETPVDNPILLEDEPDGRESE